MTDPVQVKRTREIESLSNLYFIHPISRKLVDVFARMGVAPNAVSAMGIVFGILAAWSYYHYEQWEYSVLGFLAMIMWHVMDGADGQLARLTGKTSEFGRIMDGLCDHLTVTLVYLSLAISESIDHGIWVFFLGVAAGVSHLIQSSAYEFQRQMYDYWVYGKESARFVTIEEMRADVRERSGVGRLFARAYLFYLTVQRGFAASDRELYGQLEELKEQGDPANSRARDLYRSLNVSVMKRWSLLSNNPRTILIFVAALLGLPVIYFILEITVFNAALWYLVERQRDRYSTLKGRLAEIGQSAPVAVLETQ